MKAGEQLRAAVRLSSDSVVLQFGVRRAAGATRYYQEQTCLSIVYNILAFSFIAAAGIPSSPG